MGKFTPLNDKDRVSYYSKEESKKNVFFQGRKLRADFQEVDLGIELFL